MLVKISRPRLLIHYLLRCWFRRKIPNSFVGSQCLKTSLELCICSSSAVLQKGPLKSSVCRNNHSHGHICLEGSATDKYYMDMWK